MPPIELVQLVGMKVEVSSAMRRERKTPILVVEDDASLRHLYWQALTFEGFDVLTVEDAESALGFLEHTTPAAVVLDLNLPRMSGTQLYRRLMADPATQDIPVIIVTGADPADVVAQASALLTKPVPVVQLVKEVHRLVHANA